VQADQPPPATGQGLARRYIFAATLGNALEFYDFVTFAFFAIQIGHAFFPAQSAFGSLMLSLATFGAGFITRPIGGVVIGHYADRVGRRSAMVLSFTLMGLAVIALALIPSYATIGVAAPVLAIVARMVQGFALGGEVGPNTAYLLEAAPPQRRGAIVAWQGGSQQIAAIVGSLVGLGLAAVLTDAALADYGWRIAFLLGGVTLPVGIWLRRTLPETLHAPEPAPPRESPRTAALPANVRLLTLGLLILSSTTIGTYVVNYMTTFAQNTLHLAPPIAFAATLMPNVGSFCGVLFGGWLSDRVGRRPMMIWPKLIGLLLIMPVFHWIVVSHSVLALLGGVTLASLFAAMANGAFYPALAESLPKNIRGRAFGIAYAVAITVFGGTTQLVVTWLIHVTGDQMAPGWYWLAASIVGFVAMILMLESAPAKAARLAPRPV